MRICIVKATGKLIEAQETARAGTLLRNATNAGYRIEDIEEKICTLGELISILNNLPERVTLENARLQMDSDIVENLPSWQQVSDAIDAATTIAACKVILKRLARVVYWLAKNRND